MRQYRGFLSIKIILFPDTLLFFVVGSCIGLVSNGKLKNKFN